MIANFIEFDPEAYRSVHHNDVKHFIPVHDVSHHNLPNCTCGADEIAINGVIEIVVHRAFDKRELLEEVQFTEDLLAGSFMRKEYMDTCDSLLSEGKISKPVHMMKRMLFEGQFQEKFRTN